MLAPVCLTLICILDGITVAGIIMYGPTDWFLRMLAAVGLHILYCIAVNWILILFFPIKIGVYEMSDPMAKRWQARGVVALVSSIFFDPAVPFFFKPFWYRLYGAKIAPGATIAGQVVDCSLLEMEAGSGIGGGAIVFGHLISNGRIGIGPVIVRKGAMVGAGAIVCPGVVVGEDAIVGVGGNVMPWVKIPDGEVWLGNPAQPKEKRGGSLNGRNESRIKVPSSI